MEFYTEERFKNWIDKIAKSEIKEDDPRTFEVFDQFVEDFAIACLNLIRSVREREITKKDAIREIENINRLFLISVDFGDDVKNEFFEFIRESIRIIAYSTKLFLEGKGSKKSFDDLLKDAIRKEKKGDYRGAFETMAKMGVKVLRGEELPELQANGFIANWLDGIEVIDMIMKLNKIDSGSE